MNSYRDGMYSPSWIGSDSSNALANMIAKGGHGSLLNFIPLLNKDATLSCSPLKTVVNILERHWDLASTLHHLVLTGYLTYCKRETSSPIEMRKISYLENNVKIPNQEVRDMWIDELAEVLGGRYLFNPESQETLRTIFARSVFNEEELRTYLEELLEHHPFQDWKDQNSYHRVILSAFIAAFSGSSTIEIKSNQISKRKPPEIAIHFKTAKRAFLFEFKNSSNEPLLRANAEKALSQSQKKCGLMYNDCERAYIGIAFYGKQLSHLEVRRVQPKSPL
jgi:hypothetical protein